MDLLEKRLSEIMEASKTEINNFKKILEHEKVRNSKNHELLSKYVPLIIFSIWEGFFKDSIKEYYSYFNRNEKFERDFQMFTNILEHHKLLKDKYINFDSKMGLLKDIKNIFDDPQFDEKRSHMSPTSFKDTNKFLKQLKIQQFDYKYSYNYGQLAHLRNKVAHWDDVLPIGESDIDEYILLVSNLMDDLEHNILNSIEIRDN